MIESKPIPKLPLLEALAARRNLSVLPIYTNRDVAALFGVSLRTTQDWARDRKLVPRNLPGHGRFLPEDLEIFLETSAKTTKEVQSSAPRRVISRGSV